LGSADSITLDLTDTDDLDGTYLIDQDGMIDLPFVGRIKIGDLTINEAQNILMQIVKKFYKNPDLQIEVIEFNSSKVYIVGAVRNQITINLDQKPIRLIEAAIQANFNPSAADKLYGTKGILRRDNQVYKINLDNTFKSTDERENFYLKKDDVIFIDRNSDAIHVFGEITKPGIYFPNMNYSLTELISTSGLNQITANAKKVFVIREKYNSFLEVDVFQLDIRNPVNLIVGRKFKLQANDIVFVPPAEIVKWNRTISLLLPQTDLFKSYNPIINNGLQTYREP
jgi:polysaccharide export outer membrane protein